MAKTRSSDPAREIIRPNEMIIHEGNYHRVCDPTLLVNGERKARGLIPRDYGTHPLGFYEGIKPYKAVDIPVIPQSEWAERCADQLKAQRRCSDFRRRGNLGKPIPSRDQNGEPFCWMHSGVSAFLVKRAGMNEEYVDLSPFGPACKIKNFRSDGGWGAAGVDFIIKNGCPSSKTWPQRSKSKKYDNADTWKEAALYKITEGWIDMGDADYSRNLTFAQYATLWLSGDPTINDYNWWGHSVCGCDLVDGSKTRKMCRDEDSGKLLALKLFERVWEFDNPVTAGFGCREWNSWGDSFSDLGESVLTGNRAVPDGGVGLRVVTAA